MPERAIHNLLLAACILASSPAAPALASQPVPHFDQSRPGGTDDVVYELSLDDAVVLVQQRSFRTARARRGLDQSELRYGNARSQYLPRLNTNISGDQSARGYRYDADRFDPVEQQLRSEFRSAANADVSVPIDFGGVIKRQVRQADIARNISARDLANAMLDVTLEVQNSYLNALRAQNSADADEGVVAEIERLLARSGPDSPIASFLQVELANARQSAQNSRENADNAQDGLKQLLRAPPEAKLRLTTDFKDQKQPVGREGLLQRALGGRPDLQAALLRVQQAETSMQQAADYRKPSVRVGAFASQQLSGKTFYGGDLDKFRQEGGGLNIAVPFLQWDNGQLRRNREVARIQRDQAESDAQELKERIAYDVRQQLLAVTRAENRIRNLPDRRQALQSLQRAEQGLLSAAPETQQALLAQVSNARHAWRSAETATADAYIDYNTAVFRLKRLVGDGHVADEQHELPHVALIDPASLMNSQASGRK